MQNGNLMPEGEDLSVAPLTPDTSSSPRRAIRSWNRCETTVDTASHGTRSQPRTDAFSAPSGHLGGWPAQRPRLGSEIHQAFAQGDRDGLGSGLGAELVQQVVDMVIDRRDADAETFGDLRVRETTGDES